MMGEDDAREPIERGQTPGVPEPVLSYHVPPPYVRPKPAPFASGFAMAFMFVLLAIPSFLLPVRGVFYGLGALAIGVLAYGVHNWAVSGSGRFIGGLMAGTLTLLGIAFLLLLAICGK